LRSAEHSDPAAGEVLRRWLEDDVLPAFDQRILQVDLHVARVSARCHVPDPKDLRDTLIAATAAVHGLTVVTRNSRHFARLPAPTFNPWT
jgi:predicted nucleic acid-binding protein